MRKRDQVAAVTFDDPQLRLSPVAVGPDEGTTARRPHASGAHIAAVYSALAGVGWQTAATLGAHLGPEFDARLLREVAQHSDGGILSGQRGYRLTAEATVDEVCGAVRRLRSQADHMRARAGEIVTMRRRHAG